MTIIEAVHDAMFELGFNVPTNQIHALANEYYGGEIAQGTLRAAVSRVKKLLGVTRVTPTSIVYDLLDKYGHKTSIAFLQNEVFKKLGEVPAYFLVTRARGYWKKRKGITCDARTHRHITRRNMLKDTKISARQMTALRDVRSHTDMLQAINSFHSIDQLKNALRLIVES